jgi:hypothetical protein
MIIEIFFACGAAAGRTAPKLLERRRALLPTSLSLSDLLP